MTRIDFYILPETSGPADSPVMTACRLCDKAAGAGKRVYVRAPAAVAVDFDGALWSFRQGASSHTNATAADRRRSRSPPC